MCNISFYIVAVFVGVKIFIWIGILNGESEGKYEVGEHGRASVGITLKYPLYAYLYTMYIQVSFAKCAFFV